MLRVVIAGSLLLAALTSSPAWSCATCLCGDPTITIMGTEKPFAGRMRAGIDYLRRGEKVGQPNINEHEIDEERISYSFSYAPNADWMLAASLPLVTKQVRRFDLSRQRASGTSDLDLSARWFVGTDDLFPARRLWGLQFGIRLPTSSEQMSGGQAVDFDAQPGAGATIPSVGAWYGNYRMPWFFYASSVIQHAVDDGYQGYQSGDVLLMTGHSQYAPHHRWALQFSLDGRWKWPDHYNGVRDGDSGGVLIMASPSIAVTPVEDLVMNLSYQLPVVERLRGHQHEQAVARFGVSYDF